MPVAVRICPDQMSRDEYDHVIKDLEDAGYGEPEGRQLHAAYGHDHVHMFEIWDSPEQFEAHQRQFLATLEAAGMDAGTCEVHPLHSDLPD
jgi:quinol monooxygenase YgiN